mgnify:CR=1 FL=1
MFVQKKWGYEFWIENNSLYCGKHLHVLPNKFCSVHYHKNKKETFYVIKGKLVLQYSTNLSLDQWNNYEYDTILLKKGDSFTLEPMTAHRFTSGSNFSCDFIEISTHHDDNDSYRIIESF